MELSWIDQGKTLEEKGSFGVGQNIIFGICLFGGWQLAVGHLSQAFKEERSALQIFQIYKFMSHWHLDGI